MTRLLDDTNDAELPAPRHHGHHPHRGRPEPAARSSGRAPGRASAAASAGASPLHAQIDHRLTTAEVEAAALEHAELDDLQAALAGGESHEVHRAAHAVRQSLALVEHELHGVRPLIARAGSEEDQIRELQVMSRLTEVRRTATPLLAKVSRHHGHPHPAAQPAAPALIAHDPPPALGHAYATADENVAAMIDRPAAYDETRATLDMPTPAKPHADPGLIDL